MAEHRVPMLSSVLRRSILRRHPDPAESREPRVRELVGALATLDVAPPLRAEFRADLRAQLVAITARVVAEGDLVPTGVADEPPAASDEVGARRSRRRVHVAKPLIAAACVLTAVVLLLGGAVLLSRRALPGDALYGLKRAGESTEYGLASGAVDKGGLKLKFAGNRIGEVADLLPQASAMAPGIGVMADSGQLNSSTADLVAQTLDAAQSDIRTGSQLLTTAAVQNSTVAPLTTINEWTPAQLSAVHAIAGRIPAGQLRTQAVATWSLLRAISARATALSHDLGCSCLSSTGSDSLGPLPCAGTCIPTVAPGAPTTGTPTASPTTGSAGPQTPAGSRFPTSGTRPGQPRTSASDPGHRRVAPTGAPGTPGGARTGGGSHPSPTGGHAHRPGPAPSTPGPPGVLPTLDPTRPHPSKVPTAHPLPSRRPVRSILPSGLPSIPVSIPPIPPSILPSVSSSLPPLPPLLGAAASLPVLATSSCSLQVGQLTVTIC